jgi:hypothetical protein
VDNCSNNGDSRWYIVPHLGKAMMFKNFVCLVVTLA